MWIDFALQNGESFFMRKIFLGDDLREYDPRHQGFCIDCDTFGPASFADDPEHKLNGDVSFASRFNSELYAEIRGDIVTLGFDIDDSFFYGGCPDIGSVYVETFVTRLQFIKLSESIRNSISKDIFELAIRNYEDYVNKTEPPTAYCGGFKRQ